jgi:hypothetical protein
MYNMFCRNLTNFYKVNGFNDNMVSHRFSISKPLLLLANIELYKEQKLLNSTSFREIENLLYEIEQQITQFPSFKAFSWEIWGYGFDKKRHTEFHESIVFEQLTLIDLLLSCHYWIAA